jgi:hypothetical protein
MLPAAAVGPTAAHDRGRHRGPTVIAALAAGVLTLGVVGCSSGSGSGDSTGPGSVGGANPTTRSGEGAGGGPNPDGSSTSSTSVPDIAGGVTISVTGTLSGVRRSPDQQYVSCEYLTTADAVLALETADRQYEVISNVEPIQLEIRDAETGQPVAELGDQVAVVGVRHPDPTPVGGQSYRCDGATGYLGVTSIERIG